MNGCTRNRELQSYPPPKLELIKTSTDALRSLAKCLSEIADGSANSFIVSGVNRLPRDLDDENLPHDVLPNARLRTLISRFYQRQTSCECRIRDCAAVLHGFSDIMNHEKCHGRQYSHMCVHKSCMIPFDKLGNAKRHMSTIHKRTQKHIQSVSVTGRQECIQRSYFRLQKAKRPSASQNGKEIRSSKVEQNAPSAGHYFDSNVYDANLQQSCKAIKSHGTGSSCSRSQSSAQSTLESTETENWPGLGTVLRWNSDFDKPSVGLLRKQLAGLLPPKEHDNALDCILRTFPDMMRGSPPFSEVLALATGSALYLNFARAVIGTNGEKLQLEEVLDPDKPEYLSSQNVFLSQRNVTEGHQTT